MAVQCSISCFQNLKTFSVNAIAVFVRVKRDVDEPFLVLILTLCLLWSLSRAR